MNVQGSELIGYCGLGCGDCFSYKGKIADLARDLRKKLRETKFAVIAMNMRPVPNSTSLSRYTVMLTSRT